MATDVSKNLTSTVSGLSPAFTGLNLSGLTASSLVATDGSKNLTNTISGISPTFAGLTTSGAFSGGTGDCTNITNPNLKITGSGASFPRIVSTSGDATVCVAYNYQTGKNVYWGESADTGVYYFRGRTVDFDKSLNFSGTATKRLTFANALQTRTIQMYSTADNDHQTWSIGINAGMTRFQIGQTSDSFVYYAGVNSTTSNEVFRITGTGYAQAQDGAVGTPSYSFANDTNTGIYRIGADNLGVACNGTKLIDVLSAGITQPIQPSWNAYVGSTVLNVTGDFTTYTVIFNTELHDAGTNFNTTTGTFTAPVAGRYLLSTSVGLTGMASTNTSGQLDIHDGTTTLAGAWFNPYACMNTNSYLHTASVNTVLQLTAGQALVVRITVGNTGKGVDVMGGRSISWFSGQLLS